MDKKTIKRLLIVLVALGVVFGGIFGFKAFVNTQITAFFDNFQPPPQSVSTAVADEATWQPVIPAVGTLSAVNGVDITAEVSGVVRTIAFESGQRVEAGTVLLELDTETDRADLAALEAQRALAQSELKRQKELFERRTTSRAAYDAAIADARRINAQIEAQRARLDKKTIKAPFAGEIGIRQVDLGEFVSPGTPVVTLQQLDPILVDFTLPEQRLGDIAVGQNVQLRVDAFPDAQFTAPINAINPRVTAATRTISVQARLSNADRRLRPGMFARVEVLLPQRDGVVTLPRTAITFNPYGDSVYIVTDEPPQQPGQAASGEDAGAEQPSDQPPPKFVKRKFVKLGQTRGDQVEVIDGVAAGDEVVTAGQLKLRNGSAVVIDNERTPSNEAAPKPENT